METTIPSTATGTWYYSEPVAPLNGEPRPALEPEAERGWDEVIDKLLVIRGYEDDWDGEGSRAPAKELVDGAITLVQAMRDSGQPPIGAVASDEGTVIVEWHLSKGTRIVEVVSPIEAIVRWVLKGSCQTFQARYHRQV